MYPYYALYNNRIKSFATFPESVTIPINEIASTGLFYKRDGDATQCFYCGIILLSWRPNDDPKEEHIKHSPHCAVAQEIVLSSKKYKRNRRSLSLDSLPLIKHHHSPPPSPSRNLEVCAICMINPKQVLFLPCGHIILCLLCSLANATLTNKCSFCRATIISTKRIYLV